MGRERVELPRCVWEFREEKEVPDLKSNTPFAQERSLHANLLQWSLCGHMQNRSQISTILFSLPLKMACRQQRCFIGK